MDNLYTLIAYIIVLTVIAAIIVGVFALIALIVWGIGNAIIYLFAISATWSYLQSCVTTFLLWGIRKIFRTFIR